MSDIRVTTPASASMVGRLKRIDDMGDEVDCVRRCVGWKLFRGDVLEFEVW